MRNRIQSKLAGRRLLAATGLALALAAPLAAQSRLFVQGPGDKYYVVVKISGGRPIFMQEGKAVAGKGERFALKKVEEYLPVLITVRDLEASSSSMRTAATNTDLNNEFHFRARFESADLLEDVFIVLELEISNVGKLIYAYEIGRLEARTPKPFDVNLPVGQHLGAGQLKLHLFVAGAEVFQSEQPAEYREEQLDRMIAKRTIAAPQAAPKPFFGSTPAYPAALRQSRLKGEAVVTMRITAQGRVLDPVVDRASEPPFGEEALAAVRQWRFLPRVVDGRAVETRVSIPFVFDPPPPGQ